MNTSQRLILWLYTRLLELYPSAFQAEYSAEMLEIFAAELQRAGQRGMLATLHLAWLELRDLPGAVISQRRRASGGPAGPTRPASLAQALAAISPFLILGVFFNLIGYLPVALPDWLMLLVGFSSVGLVLVLTIIGLARGLPTWWMPNLGIFGAFASLLFFNATIEWIYNPQQPILDPYGPWIGRVFFQGGYLWFGLLVIATLLVMLAALLQPFQPFYRRLYADWTLLSFGLYGAALPAILFTFDDYINDEPFKALTALALAAGAWFYLRHSLAWRSLPLLLGLAFAALATSLGKTLLFSGLPWQAQSAFTWQSEALSTLILWGWLALVVLSPALLRFLPAPPPEPA